MQLSKQLINKIQDSFKNISDREDKIYRIKFCGKYITNRSGKTVWRTKGYARSAFNSHLSNISFDEFGIDCRNRKGLIVSLEKEGYVEFVAFSHEG